MRNERSVRTVLTVAAVAAAIPILLGVRAVVDRATLLEASQESTSMSDRAKFVGTYRLITTEIKDQQTFYYAEEYHQQYLAKNPGGYCGLGGTGVSCG